MNGTAETEVSSDFKWSPEYDQVLETLASSDYVPDHDWDKLRDMIKFKLKQNIASYMSDPPPPPPPEPVPIVPEPPSASPQSASTTTTLSPGVLPTTSAKFPPFPIREENQFIRNEYNSYGRAKTVLKEEEAKEMYEGICKLLHDFEGNPPFTIQRLCELIVRPRQHFKFAGKYLRAVERALLVTSTIDAFPIISAEENDASSSPFISIGSLREATTPLFSPIPFLHEDARRSRSRSPPMSPLNLATNAPARPLSPSTFSLDLPAVETCTPVFGFVDELDDPGPGHLSDHPTALTSTTTGTTTTTTSTTTTSSTAPNAEESTASGTATATTAAAATAPTPKPMFGGSLQERFVKSSTSTTEAEMTTEEKTPSSTATSSSESASAGDQPPSSSGAGAAPESQSQPTSGSVLGGDGAGSASDIPSEAVSASSGNGMAVDETEADKENVPKS